MDKIILGMLMLKRLTIYELRNYIKNNFSSMCSDSMGSIQATIKNLLKKKMITYNEFVENSVNKKVYEITDEGKEYFNEWIQTSMLSGKEKNMELSKLFFMGFVPVNKRSNLIDAYIIDLKTEREELEKIRTATQDSETEKLKYLAYLKENESQLNSLLEITNSQSLQQSIQDIIDFELSTLQLSLDKINFEIQWFEKFKKTICRKGNEKCQIN